ncbi:glycoside hydrolase family 3 protein [Cellulomonas endophytica]|uniref:glycoside hydrolase family 3 protein n=1 Tax=Cellulomonas endophytica TaxID=2494735 RepID=UPI00101111D8|nr:glycoside hydrolase family 3 N-terminal domain-containing protein [Cellulomonas endophytica]
MRPDLPTPAAAPAPAPRPTPGRAPVRAPGRARRGRRAGTGLAVVGLLCGSAAAGLAGPASAADVEQPVLSSRSVPLLTVDGLTFRDLDRDGALTPYEDWRLTPTRRADDLVGRMTLEQKAGLLVHGTLPAAGSTYDVAATTDLVGARHVTTFITRLSAPPTALATANNLVQEIAEQQPLGIPVVISSDPRNGFSVTAGQTVARVGTTAMPDEIGMAATGDPALVERLGDIIRQEYRAVGLTEGLSPQADIATEPRWTRINGTFGSDPGRARAMVQAYVTGLQGGTTGLHPGSVATVTKHWAGYGAQENGYDSHYYYGRYATFPGGGFDAHLVPFEGAFAAGTSGIMPTYSILRDLVHEGTAVEQTGAGFSEYLLQDLLRGEYGFDGVIVSDWGITGDCPAECRANRPPAFFVGPWGAGMPWGVEDSTVLDRFALTLNAGVNQVGGSNEPSYVVQAVRAGLLDEAVVDDSAHRVLQQKVELGLFENPFVDAAAAATVAGSEAFTAVGDAAQAASLTLLTNTDDVLPAEPASTPAVWLSGVSAAAAEAVGYTVVESVADADLAVVRLADPRGGADLTDLGWTGQEADHAALQAAVDAGVPTVAVPKLDRPLVLTDVADRAAAVLGAYGVSDEVLMETVAGERRPGGRLPFELPSSMEAVRAQLADVPDDSADPLFAVGHGLDYAAPTIADLRDDLAALHASDEVRGPVAHLLAVHADAAQRYLDRGRTEAAVRELERFVGRLDAPPGASRVSEEAERVLRQEAEAVVDSLS